jgi:hypothetical protein
MPTYAVLLAVVAAVLALAANQVVVAQPPAAAAPPPAAQAAPPAPDMDMDQMMQQMGMNPKEAMMMKLLGQGNIDPMLLLMMMNGGGMDDDVIGPMMFMRMLSGATAAPTQPVVLLDANTLIIVEGGTVYKVNLATMTVMDTVNYKPQAAQANPLQSLLPMLMMGRSATRVEAAREQAAEDEPRMEEARPEPAPEMGGERR